MKKVYIQILALIGLVVILIALAVAFNFDFSKTGIGNIATSTPGASLIDESTKEVDNNEVSSTNTIGDGMVACTMDAKMCSDGSYVGRTGPKCEFQKCPGE